MNTSIESIDDLSKFSQKEIFNYIKKLQANNAQNNEVDVNLRRSNIFLNNKITQLEDENAKLRKELEIKND